MKGGPRVKVCGITRLEDAVLAVELGASAVGFIFWPKSPRVIRAQNAREIARALPPFIARVGVFVNATPDDVAGVVSAVGLDVAQLHGDEDVCDYARVGARLLKVAHIEAEDGVAAAVTLPVDVTPIVDAVDRERRGGTGRSADWIRAARLAAARPIVLAGGLTPENVGDAIEMVRPWALDVSSGVEDAPGIKSPAKLRRFFLRVHGTKAEAL